MTTPSDYNASGRKRPGYRRAQTKAHRVFDSLWKSGAMTRDEAYAWLREVMQTKPGEGHISRLSCEQCRALIEHVKKHPAYAPLP